MPFGTAMQHRACVDHFRVQQRVAAEQAMEIPAMAIRPVHHRGNGQAPWAK